jgi:hypothetical protein
MRIVVLFNLRPDVKAEDYVAWAKSVDIPTVNALKSIDSFRVHRITGVLGSDARPPYGYVEIIDVADMGTFGEEIATDAMKRIAAAFQAFADNPIFLTTEDL